MVRSLFTRFWEDESGAVIATEYLMLGTIVAAGGTTGLVAMRDAMVSEYEDFGDTIREVRQEYTPPLKRARAKQHQPLETTDPLVIGVPQYQFRTP